MGGLKRWLLIGVMVLGCLSGVAQAESEMDILLDVLVQNGTITPVQAGQIRRQVAETKEARNKQLAKELVPDSARNWKWGGDIRLRQESRNRTGTGQDVNRQRIRFRYGFEAKVTDRFKVGARLASGATNDPVSTNQTFDQSFNHNNFLLDRAFAEYTPELPGITEVKLSGGKIENPFWLVGPLVWDDDLNFDGAAVRLSQDLGPMATVFTNDGVFLLQSGITEAASLWSTQGGIVLKPSPDSEDELMKNFKLTAALSFHDYKNVTNPLSESSAITTAGGLKGNTTGIRDLNLLNPTFEVGSQYRDVPFGLFGDWIHNTAISKGNNNEGFMIGLKAGKARIPFDLLKGWEGGYFFERLEPDATFGAFTDSDFGNGGTNHLGHVWWIKLATLKNSSVQLKYFTTKQLTGSKNHADTFQADWVTKF
ncbi:MAG: putative porin [Candidatus Omnitrophica bacterium]|nr:putative porin [Candidatus Omnitrophota bacterium]